jgi:PAS domain S-box-containing protein
VTKLRKAKIQEVLQSGEPIRFKDAREGEIYDNNFYPVFDTKGNVTAVAVFATCITERVRARDALRESELKYRSLFVESRDAIYITSREGELLDANVALLKLFGYTREEMIGNLNVRQLYIYPNERKKFQQEVEEKGSVRDYEVRFRKKDATEMVCLLSSTVRRSNDGSILGYQGIIRDITEHKRAEEALKRREQDLRYKTKDLEEANTALRVLLKSRDEDKTELEEKVLFNVKELVEPFVEKLNNSELDGRQKAYLGVLESNLNDIVSPFSRSLSFKYLSLTPTEIQVANLIKQGKTTKEAANLLNLSSRTIESHRKNIRKKMGITDKKANLRTHLLSLQ